MGEAPKTPSARWTRTALSLNRTAQALGSFEVRVGKAPPQAGLIKVSHCVGKCEAKRFLPCHQVMMVCGGDLIGTFKDIKADGEPLWLAEDRDIILARNGIVCIVREGTDLEAVGLRGA
jgi:hypothetical protein